MTGDQIFQLIKTVGQEDHDLDTTEFRQKLAAALEKELDSPKIQVTCDPSPADIISGYLTISLRIDIASHRTTFEEIGL